MTTALLAFLHSDRAYLARQAGRYRALAGQARRQDARLAWSARALEAENLAYRTPYSAA